MTEKDQNNRQQKFSGTKPVQSHLKFDSDKLAQWLSKSLDKSVYIKKVEEFKGKSFGTFFSRILNQFLMIFNSFGSDGGLFVLIGRKK